MKSLALDRGDAHPENRNEENWPFIEWWNHPEGKVVGPA